MLSSSILWALFRGRALLWALTTRELQARHAGSVAGVVWAYAQPLLTIASYYLVFDVVFALRMGADAPAKAVGVYLIVGALPWMSFGDAVSRATQGLVEAGGLLQKNPLPPSMFPARVVLASGLIFSPLMLALAAAYWPVHHGATALLALPVVWLAQLALVFWLGHLLALFHAAVRDTGQVVTFFLQIGIFLSPALFPYTQFPEAWRWVLWFNPMTPFLLAYQNILLQGNFPSWEMWTAIAAWPLVLAVPTGVFLRRCRDQLVDWL